MVHKGIEQSEKLILQLISTKIPSDYVDIALIKKCNTIDLPALQSASKICEKSLLKYLSFPGVDNSYCDRISSLLDNTESWALHIVQAYTSTEVNSIKGSPEDIADIGIFFDNADKTVFKFLESFELGYIDWGNNRQRGSKLCKHLVLLMILSWLWVNEKKRFLLIVLKDICTYLPYLQHYNSRKSLSVLISLLDSN